MLKLVIRDEERRIAEKPVKVSSSIILRPLASISEDELQERVSLAQEIGRGLKEIEIRDVVTGEIERVPIERVLTAFPSLNLDETYIETESRIDVVEENPITEAELNEELKRHGLKPI